MQLTETELFKDISAQSFEALKNHLRLRIIHYKKNETVCSYGNGSDRIGIILSGRAAIFRTDYNGYESLLEYLPEGAIFSEEMSYAKTAGDSILVRCTAKSSIAYLNYKTFKDGFAEIIPNSKTDTETLRKNFINMLINRSKLLSERVEVLGCHSIREKLLCYFRLRLQGKEIGKLELPFTWIELASYIGADRCAMMREITLMNKDGIIHTDRKKITVLKNFSDNS